MKTNDCIRILLICLKCFRFDACFRSSHESLTDHVKKLYLPVETSVPRPTAELR